MTGARGLGGARHVGGALLSPGRPAAPARHVGAAPLWPLCLLGGEVEAEEPPSPAGAVAQGVAEGQAAPWVLSGPRGDQGVASGVLDRGEGPRLYV